MPICKLLSARAILAAVAVLPSTLSAQNLISNPDFTTDLSGWQLSRGNGLALSPYVALNLDLNEGSPTAPSMHIAEVSEPVLPDGVDIWSDCLPVDASVRYDAALDHKSNWPFTSAILYMYTNTACSGVAVTRNLSNCPTIAGGWQRCVTTNIPMAAGTVRARLRVTIPLLPAHQQPFIELWLDNVRFGPTGSVPVELQTFSVD